MGSKPRLILQGAIYQVRAESARGETIFEKDTIKRFFLQLFESKLIEHAYKCYAFSVEKDHYHLAIRTGIIPISKFLQSINSIFAKHYNKSCGTHGAVFSRPFTSILIQEELGLKELVRYIHLNPLRCNSCTEQELETYQWCGHGALLKKCQNSFLCTEEVLNQFSQVDKSAAYEEFVRRGFSNDDCIIKQIRNANSGKQIFRDPSHQVVGTKEFLEMAIEKDQCGRIKVPRYILEQCSFDIIQENVEALLDLQKGALLRQGRLNVRSTARELFAYIARYRLDYSGVQIASYLNITDSAVSRMLSRFENINRKDYLVDAVSELLFTGVAA